jgi:hypothetical protein
MYGAAAMEAPLPKLTLAARIAGEDPRRRVILKMLDDQPGSIPQLIGRWPRDAPPQPKVHYQIGHLVEAHCVEAVTHDERRSTKEPIYSVTPMGKALLASFVA